MLKYSICNKQIPLKEWQFRNLRKLWYCDKGDQRCHFSYHSLNGIVHISQVIFSRRFLTCSHAYCNKNNLCNVSCGFHFGRFWLLLSLRKTEKDIVRIFRYLWDLFTLTSIMIWASLFVSARNWLKIKERQILSKMHFKPIGSSAVVELHKLTDYNSGHRDEEQLHFHFLGKAFELPAPLMWEFKYLASTFTFIHF